MNLSNLARRGWKKVRSDGIVKVASLVADDIGFKTKVSAMKRFPRLTQMVSPKLRGVFLEPTNNCNLRCKMCPRGSRSTGFMEWSLFTKTIDEISAVGNVTLVMHMGGESLTHPRFLDMLDYVLAQRSKLRAVGFVTNGTLLSDKVQQKLVNLQVDWVTVSLDGLGKVNDEIRIGSRYDQIEENINSLLEKRGTKTKPNVGLSLTDVGQARNEIDEFVKAWVDKVDYIRVGVCQDNRNVIIDRTYFNGLELETNKMCVSPFGSMAIFWNGDVAPCCTDINGKQILGNVSKQSLLSLWSGYNFKQMRYDMATHREHNHILCGTCELWQTSFKPRTVNHAGHIIQYESMWKFHKKQSD